MGDSHVSGAIVANGGVKVGTADSSTAVIDSVGNIVNGPSITRPYTLLTDNTILTAAQSGGVFGIATDAKTITLPAAAAGLEFTIINTGAAGNNLIDIVAPGGVIAGTITLAATVVVVSAATTLRLTKVTSILGDSITLTSNGTNWYITSVSGIWAQQAP